MVGLTLTAFAATSLVHVDPAVVAAAGAAALAVPALVTAQARPRDLVRAAGLPFLAFVLALGIIVRAISAGEVGAAVARLVPSGDSLWSLPVVASLAALMANLVKTCPRS